MSLLPHWGVQESHIPGPPLEPGPSLDLGRDPLPLSPSQGVAAGRGGGPGWKGEGGSRLQGGLGVPARGVLQPAQGIF